ncbi:MAG TPA: hypothetical protein VF458_23720 [Ktedonobacteraceae bacterium]
MSQTNRTPLQVALIYGLVAGVALGVSEVALGLLIGLAPYPLAILFGRLTLVVLILAYLYAGYQAARRTGNLYAGTAAGALTGAFGVLTVIALFYLSSFFHTYLFFDPAFLLIPASLPLTSTLASPLVNLVLTFAVYGAIVGTLGGLIGKRRSLHS